VDWNLRACGRHGHETYQPTEPGLAERLHAETAAGDAWRCLRCGDFVLGAPRRSGPAADAPVVLRGRALRDAVVLRLLAVERLVRGVVIALLSYAVFSLRSSQATLNQLFQQKLPALRTAADAFNWNIDDSSMVHTIRSVLSAKSSTLDLVGIGLAAYAALQLVEGVGLWLLKRWGEYFAVVATSVFIPFEVHEILKKVTWLRIAAFVVNVAAVVYLLWSKRLFGIGGGKAAYEAARHSAALLEVERAALEADRAPSAAVGSPQPDPG
jgi:uncharacterized membrane protein (DUF2068 family)